jgi:hypothetical protein
MSGEYPDHSSIEFALRNEGYEEARGELDTRFKRDWLDRLCRQARGKKKMGRVWKVRVIGVVSRLEGTRRFPVPTGDYDMREVETESYQLSRDGGPTFILTVTEVGTYTNDNQMKVIEGSWP